MRSRPISIPLFVLVTALLLSGDPRLFPLPHFPSQALGESSGVEADGDAVEEQAEFYQYTDKEGVIHFADSIENIPPRYRNRMIVRKERTEVRNTTEIRIVDNQVLVPVSFRNGGRTAQALLLLDTGASITCITLELAARLGIEPESARAVTMGMADGSMVDIRVLKVSALAVGDRMRTSFEIGILPRQVTGKEYNGYLGLDFLSGFQYQIDFQNSLIRWQ